MKNFLTGTELTKPEIQTIIQQAIQWKKSGKTFCTNNPQNSHLESHNSNLKNLTPRTSHLASHTSNLKKLAPRISNLEPPTMTALFANPSLRTRLSFESGMQKLGGHCNVMNLATGYELEYEFGVTMDSTKAEHAKEAAQVVSRYSDIIGMRNSSLITRDANTAEVKDNYSTYKSDQAITQFAHYATTPVINMESNMYHPCQGLADAMTICEIRESKLVSLEKGDTEGLSNKTPFTFPLSKGDKNELNSQNISEKNLKYVLSWAPHPKALPLATPHSQLLMPAYLDNIDITLCCPPEFMLDPDVIQQTEEVLGKPVTISHDQTEAFQDADVITAKSWVSIPHFGDWEAEKNIRNQYQSWTITKEKMALTNQAAFMHCLPMRRNIIASDEVIDSPQSKIIDQAENRMWAQMALISYLLNNEL